ncbi:MAG TPA: hypothetical protein VM054_03890 [bacterium]|nr:hypothetical protein [bacterium]
MRGIGLILVTLLVLGSAADVRGPDFWTSLENEYYSAYLERYDDFIILDGVVWEEAALLDGDPAAGYVFPLALGPVEAGSEIEIELPPVPEYDPAREPYSVHVYFGVSGDEWVDRDVAYTVTHRFTGGEYDTAAVEGHCWSAPVTSGRMSGSLHSVVVQTGGFFAETEGVETTGVSRLFLVVGVLAADAPDFEKIAESLREEPPEGTTVVFSEP